LWNLIGVHLTATHVCLDPEPSESLVSTVVVLRPALARIVDQFQARVKIFLFYEAFRLSLRPAEPPLDNRYKVNRPERENDESLATSDEVSNVWSYASTFPYAFEVRKGTVLPSLLNIYENRVCLSVNMSINMEKFRVLIQKFFLVTESIISVTTP
jgi:hypothetical protein